MTMLLTFLADPRLAVTRAVVVAILLLFGLTTAQFAQAHTDYESLVAVDHALLRPAKAGDSAVMKLRIQNRGTGVIHLIRVETPVATGSRIVFDDGRGSLGYLESLAIRPGEELDFASSHMWIELTGLKQPLVNGDHVELRIVFAPDGWVNVVADVGAHHDH